MNVYGIDERRHSLGKPRLAPLPRPLVFLQKGKLKDPDPRVLATQKSRDLTHVGRGNDSLGGLSSGSKMGHPLCLEMRGARRGTQCPAKSGTGWSGTKSDAHGSRGPNPFPPPSFLFMDPLPQLRTTEGKAPISQLCQHMTQLEEAGCSLARVTTCRARTGKQAHFNYFSFTTPRFPGRAAPRLPAPQRPG